MTNGLPPVQIREANQDDSGAAPQKAALPNDPSQEMLPVAQPEPAPASGVPVTYQADRQTWVNKVGTLFGVEEFHYRDYVIRADKVVWHQDTSELEAEGNVQVVGGPDDLVLKASHGDMRMNMHTARFYDVSGTIGVRSGGGHSVVYSTANPFIFSGRVLLQNGQGDYRIVDGTMTNCRLPKPDWQILSRLISVSKGEASTRNSYFKVLGIPLIYLPYLRHPVDEGGRESGFLIPVVSNSSIRGYTFGEQFYWAINRSMDMVVGSEYYSKRGWAPNGDFRFKGFGLTNLTVRWNALLDRGVEQTQTTGASAGQTVLVDQGGADIVALGRKDLTDQTRVAGNAEYLSSYVYRLVFNDNYWLAVSSQVKSDLSLTHTHDGFIPSADFSRIQNFASSTNGDEARILHLPSLRYDVLDHRLGSAPLYWGAGSSIGLLSRVEPGFHARNDGRLDLYPHLSMPLAAGGWTFVPEGAVRATFYSDSQNPDLTGLNGGVPSVSHDPLHRLDAEASVDVRAPALERDFILGHWNRVLRHVIEPEITYRYVGGIGPQERNVLMVDTTDIATDTNQVGFSLTQRLYMRPASNSENSDSGATHPCTAADSSMSSQSGAGTDPQSCPDHPREWASWQIAQDYYFNPTFGGALIPGRRNVFDATLDLTPIAFLTAPRNLSPIVSRMRFEAIDNLRIEWDLDYDAKAGRLGADNVFAGYSWANTTVGIGHSLLNAVDESGSAASLIQSQQVEPFFQYGKPNREGLNLAANGGYDFVHGALQYGGVQAVYNWNCCGISLGYRRFALGSVRDETQYLYSITLANFGSAGDIRRVNTIFHDPTMPPAY